MSTGLELFADDIDGYLYVAIIKDQKLIDLYVTPPDVIGSWASIHVGKVIKIDTKLDAAFIDIGNRLTGFLPAKHALPRKAGVATPRKDVSRMLNPGQMFLVQIKAEGQNTSLYENNKIPTLTANLHVPGGFLVYSPHSDDINYSSSIDERHIEQLETNINLHGGWKVYPSAGKLSKDDINTEAKYLKKHWGTIQDKAHKLQDKTGVIEVGPIALFQALLDYGVASFDHIYAGNEIILKLMLNWSSKHFPSLAKSKRLRRFNPQDPSHKLFDIYDIYSEIDALQSKVVDLPSGANIIIENTSALTTIDVNQGSCPTRHKANLATAAEVARQIKIRNLSGIILIDFAGSPSKPKRHEIIDMLEKHLATDIGNTQVHGFTRLGMVELTRKRRTATVDEIMQAAGDMF